VADANLSDFLFRIQNIIKKDTRGRSRNLVTVEVTHLVGELYICFHKQCTQITAVGVNLIEYEITFTEDKSALKRSRHEQVDKRSDKRKYPELDHRKSNKYTEQQTKVTEHGTRRDHATGSDRYKTKHSTEHGNFDRSEGHRPSKGDDIHGDGRAEDRHADKDESRRHSHHRSRTQER